MQKKKKHNNRSAVMLGKIMSVYTLPVGNTLILAIGGSDNSSICDVSLKMLM
jgi:hypothetical protein